LANKNEVYIETALDTKALERGIAQVKQQLTSLEKSYNSLQAKQQKFLQTGGQQYTLSDEYKKASAEVERVGKALETALNRKEKLDETGAKTNTQSYKQLEHQIDQLSEKFWRAEKAKESLESSKYVVNPTWEKMQYDVDQVSSKIESGKTVLSSYQKQLNNLRKGSKSVELLKNSFSKLKKTASGLENILKKCSKSLLGFGKSSNKSFHGGFKGLLKTSIQFGIILSLIKAVTTGFTEGFKALAQFNDGMNPTNTALSNLKSSLTQLRNSLATAFSPILTVVEPILTMFIQKVSDAVTAVGMLIAKLTGAETFTKAVKVQQNFAEELDETAAGAKDAKKEMEGYLSPLDEINKMQPREKDASGVGTGVTPNDMFEEVKIPSSFGNIADKIKSMWENADFSSLGETVGTKIKEGLDGINWGPIKKTFEKIGKSLATFSSGLFETEGLGESIGRSLGEGINSGISLAKSFIDNFNFEALGTFLGELINGAVKTINWEDAGATLGTGVSGIFTTIKTFFDTTDWASLGSNIIDGIESFFKNVKWENISGSISSAVSSLFDFVSGAFQSIEWDELPSNIISSIIDFIKGFDFKKVAQSLAEMLGSAIGAVFGLIKGIGDLVGKMVNAIKNGWSKKKKEWESMGLSTWDGIKLGIVNAIKNIGSWIKTNIFSPFIDGFKKAFGIKGKSSKEMEENGAWITGGVLTALKSLPEKAKQVFNSMKTAVIRVMNALKTAIKTPINGIIGFLNKMISGIVSGINKAIGVLNKLNIKVPDWVPEIGGKTWGFNIREISAPKIPMLANGAVIPANRSFMAVLGDQKHGNNLEAPEGLIRKIVREESGGGGKTINLNVQLDGRTVYQRVIEIGKQDETILGVNPFKLA